jgi:hypothetical protein
MIYALFDPKVLRIRFLHADSIAYQSIPLLSQHAPSSVHATFETPVKSFVINKFICHGSFNYYLQIIALNRFSFCKLRNS